MSRPNHFTRPVQSDRLSQSYGNTRLGEPDCGLSAWGRALGLALLCAATLAAAALLLHAISPAVSPASAGAHSSRADETGAGLGDG